MKGKNPMTQIFIKVKDSISKLAITWYEHFNISYFESKILSRLQRSRHFLFIVSKISVNKMHNSKCISSAYSYSFTNNIVHQS